MKENKIKRDCKIIILFIFTLFIINFINALQVTGPLSSTSDRGYNPYDQYPYENMIHISNCRELQAINDYVNYAAPYGVYDSPTYKAELGTAGVFTMNDYKLPDGRPMNPVFVLDNDIDCSETRGWNNGKGFEPLGSAVGFKCSNNADGQGCFPLTNYFHYIFDGRGHKISNLYINRAEINPFTAQLSKDFDILKIVAYTPEQLNQYSYDSVYIGLFGAVAGGSGIVKNVELVNVDITGALKVGGLVGWNAGTIENCKVSGSVKSVYQKFQNLVYNTGSGSNQGGGREDNGFGGQTGGLVGSNSGNIKNSGSSVSVTGYGPFTGGLTGINGFPKVCPENWNYKAACSFGTVYDAVIYKSYSTGNVIGYGSDTGGLAGYSDGNIYKSFSSSNVIGYNVVGGLVGSGGGDMNWETIIKDSYATGKVTGNEYVGGFIGYNGYTIARYNSNRCGIIQVYNSYSTGKVEGKNIVGGFIGLLNEWNGIGKGCGSMGSFGTIRGDIINSFWDIETSGTAKSLGGGEGKTTIEMKNKETYKKYSFETDAEHFIFKASREDDNYDYMTGIWKMDSGGYPRLVWEDKKCGAEKTCSELGWSCGVYYDFICDQKTDCGGCSNGNKCENGKCISETKKLIDYWKLDNNLKDSAGKNNLYKNPGTIFKNQSGRVGIIIGKNTYENAFGISRPGYTKGVSADGSSAWYINTADSNFPNKMLQSNSFGYIMAQDDVSLDITGNSDFTISTWAYVDSDWHGSLGAKSREGGAYYPMVSKLGAGFANYEIGFDMNNHFYLLYGGYYPVVGGYPTRRITKASALRTDQIINNKYGFTTPDKQNKERWHHFVGVKSGNELKLYIDGEEQDGGIGGLQNENVLPNVVPGNHNLEISNDMSEVKVYNYALSDSEIADEYDKGVCRPSCEGKVCGDDGCGESCGICLHGQVCGKRGNCIANPCSDGFKQCNGTEIQICSQGEWEKLSSCSNEQKCIGGKCVDCLEDKDCAEGKICLNYQRILLNNASYKCVSCMNGDVQNYGESSYRTCINEEWGNIIYCTNGQKYASYLKKCVDCYYDRDCSIGKMCNSNGICISKDCSVIGGKQCFNITAYQECSSSKIWSNAISCNSGEKCVNGNCSKCLTCGDLGKQCGSGQDGCGGWLSCGYCPNGQTCSNGQCACTPSCRARQCGDNGCGGSCGSCTWGYKCDNITGKCVSKTCTPICKLTDGITPKVCGADACDGSCGACPSGQVCNSFGQCNIIDCTRNCNIKQCGNDGCGGSCGTCPSYAPYCANGGCSAQQCVPSCSGKTCGNNGCGGSCGTCGEAEECSNGKCIPGCTPSCVGKTCGDDGCGGSCDLFSGTQSPLLLCLNRSYVYSSTGCVPNCDGKECGYDDGCAGEGRGKGNCGTCPEDQPCIRGHCVNLGLSSASPTGNILDFFKKLFS